jgi:hypothetical protein
MDKPEQRFNIDTRVKLREGVDPSLYGGFSRVGNEGWIRKRKRDRYGYPQVFIQWDKDHWAYNGAEDGWTWEGQFEAVEEKEMAEATQPNNQDDTQEHVRAITENFVQAIFGALGAPPAQVGAPSDDIAEQSQAPVEDDESEGSDKWEDLAAQASEALTGAPAYLLIALECAEVPGAPPMIIPRVFHAAREPEHALIVQSQLAHILASLQDATIARVLERESDTGMDEE